MNWWILLAWLGMIRFGMEMFEESLKKLWWPKLSLIIQKYTNKWRKATLVGTIVTGILNSSTLISLLTLWFVSAGMMKLVNAVGVLVGANIWSTATGLIVGYLGFGEFKISAFALPLIAIGWLIMIVSGKKYRSYWSKLLIGFGLFFLWIDFLKENVEVMSQVFDFAQYKDMSIWIFWVIGMIITAMVQSSGAVWVMTLAALSSNIITFEAGFAIILWANIGTTFTALIASLTGTTAKRQIGIANVLFNVITVWIGIILFYPYIWLTLDGLGFRDNPVMGNAIINLIFNATTSIAFIPFLWWFTKLIQYIIPEKQEAYPLQILKNPLPTQETRYDTDIASISLKALEDDKHYIWKLALEYFSSIRWIDTKLIETHQYTDTTKKLKFDNELHRALYHSIKNQLDIIFSYIQHLADVHLSDTERKELIGLRDSFIGISNACKSTENIRENIMTITNSLDPTIHNIYNEIHGLIVRFNYAIYDHIWSYGHESPEDAMIVVKDMKSYRNNLLVRITPFIINGNVWDMDVSSLVNMSGELADGMDDMVKII